MNINMNSTGGQTDTPKYRNTEIPTGKSAGQPTDRSIDRRKMPSEKSTHQPTETPTRETNTDRESDRQPHVRMQVRTDSEKIKEPKSHRCRARKKTKTEQNKKKRRVWEEGGGGGGRGGGVGRLGAEVSRADPTAVYQRADMCLLVVHANESTGLIENVAPLGRVVLSRFLIFVVQGTDFLFPTLYAS